MDACGPISQMRVRNKWLQHPAVVLWLATSCSFAVVSAQDRCSVNVPCQFNGSCDTNTGYCACMLGYGGALCQTALYPACAKTREWSPHGFPPAMRCAPHGAKSCECLRQCAAHVQLKDPQSDLGFPCFERTGVSPGDQLSDAPAENEPARFFSRFWGHSGEPGAEISREEYARPPRGRPSAAVNSAECPERCSAEGECMRGDDGRPPECRCYPGFSGPGCASYTPGAGLCVNDCNGGGGSGSRAAVAGPPRGRCIRGVCSCSPGFFGIDCSIDLRITASLPGPGGPTVMADPPAAFDGPAVLHRPPSPAALVLGPPPPRDHPRIFVVELPPWLALAHWRDSVPGYGHCDPIYRSPELFLSRVLRDDSGVRTLNPYEANLFLVPDFNHFYSGNGSPPTDNVRRLVGFLKAHFAPFWERNGGSDFIFWAAGDPGACPIPDDLKQVIWITHLAMTNYSALRWDDPDSFSQTCFVPGHGVSAPPFLQDSGHIHRRTYGATPTTATPATTATGATGAPRPILFYFAGTLMLEHPMYSQGVRQEVFRLFQNESGFSVNSYGEHPLDEMRRATFCLCPLGSGWGMRLVQAVAYGCLPVIIQDEVVQPGEDVIPYETFSVRLSRAEVPTLAARLRAIGPEELARMQAALRKVHWYFSWDDEQGGKAFELVVASLARVLRGKAGAAGRGSSIVQLNDILAGGLGGGER